MELVELQPVLLAALEATDQRTAVALAQEHVLQPAAALVADFAEAARSDAAAASAELKALADELLEDNAAIYARVWRKVQRKDAAAFSALLAGARELAAAVNSFTDSFAPRSLQQPDAGLAGMYVSGAAGFAGFAAEMERIAAAAGAELRVAPGPKNVFRTIEKRTMVPHGTPPGRWDTVLDLFRCMVVVDGAAMDLAVLEAIASSNVLEAVRWKDRLRSPTPAGWADSMVNVRVRGGTKHVYEVQVAQKMMLTARAGLDGHEAYAQARGALEAMAAAPPRGGEAVAEAASAADETGDRATALVRHRFQCPSPQAPRNLPGGEGGGAAYLVGERAVEGDGVRLEYALELGAHGGGRLEGREASGFRGVVAPVVRGGGGHEASASAKKSPVFAVHIRRDGNAGRASRATGRVASTRAPRVHRPAPRYTRGRVEMRVRRHGQTGARVSGLRLAR